MPHSALPVFSLWLRKSHPSFVSGAMTCFTSFLKGDILHGNECYLICGLQATIIGGKLQKKKKKVPGPVPGTKQSSPMLAVPCLLPRFNTEALISADKRQ